MNEHLLVHALWRPRAASAAEGAARTERMLEQLEPQGIPDRWRSHGELGEHGEPDATENTEASGMPRRDVYRFVHFDETRPERGYVIALDHADGATLRVRFSASLRMPPYAGGEVTLVLPVRRQELRHRATGILAALVTAWDADLATIRSVPRRPVPAVDAFVPGWLTFVRSEASDAPFRIPTHFTVGPWQDGVLFESKSAPRNPSEDQERRLSSHLVRAFAAARAVTGRPRIPLATVGGADTLPSAVPAIGQRSSAP